MNRTKLPHTYCSLSMMNIGRNIILRALSVNRAKEPYNMMSSLSINRAKAPHTIYDLSMNRAKGPYTLYHLLMNTAMYLCHMH